MRATVTHVDDRDGSELIEVNGHRFQFGGQGDGYCYHHQSFGCLEQLTKAEWLAINEAELESSP